MNDTTMFSKFWWWLYNNIFFGNVAATFSCIFLVFAVYIAVRRKMFALSMVFLSIAFVIAYTGGFIMIIRSVK